MKNPFVLATTIWFGFAGLILLSSVGCGDVKLKAPDEAKIKEFDSWPGAKAQEFLKAQINKKKADNPNNVIEASQIKPVDYNWHKTFFPDYAAYDVTYSLIDPRDNQVYAYINERISIDKKGNRLTPVQVPYVLKYPQIQGAPFQIKTREDALKCADEYVNLLLEKALKPADLKITQENDGKQIWLISYRAEAPAQETEIVLWEFRLVTDAQGKLITAQGSCTFPETDIIKDPR
ncbi:MAG: hypothetical protein HY811_10465 [Planctomycetes bacterium]|nr:hypothetical protein [Planctomycetota bacterium]